MKTENIIVNPDKRRYAPPPAYLDKTTGPPRARSAPAAYWIKPGRGQRFLPEYIGPDIVNQNGNNGLLKKYMKIHKKY